MRRALALLSAVSSTTTGFLSVERTGRFSVIVRGMGDFTTTEEERAIAAGMRKAEGSAAAVAPSVAGCAIDDHDVRNIVGDYSKLHTFILAGCPITDASLTTIASCPWLFSLSLVGCPNISNEAVVALRNECKGLQVLR